jgi:hypothetical protein
MKRPKLRMTTLSLMIVIAALTFALVARERIWAEREKRREAEILTRLARSYKDLAKQHRAQARKGYPGRRDAQGNYSHGNGPMPIDLYHMEMAKKYENAAAAPFLPIKLDPPAPN